MAKFWCVIRPFCGGNEPPPVEASLCLDIDFTTDIRRLQQLVVLLRHKVVKLHHKSPFVVQLDHFLTQNARWSLITKAVVLKKWILGPPIVFALCLNVFCLVLKPFRMPDPLSPWIKKEIDIDKRNKKRKRVCYVFGKLNF